MHAVGTSRSHSWGHTGIFAELIRYLGSAALPSGLTNDYDHESYDEGRLSERLMLAADAHGVGSCIGWLINDGQDAARQLRAIADYLAGMTDRYAIREHQRLFSMRDWPVY